VSIRLRALMAEDNPADAELIVRELRRAGYAVEWHRVDRETDYVTSLREDWDIVFSDYDMPQFGAFRALALLKELGCQVPFIIVSGMIGEEMAVEAMRLGASDYLLKDRLTRLGPAVTQALAQFRLREERRQAQHLVERGLERLTEAQRIGGIGDWDYDCSTQAVTWSRQVYEILGRDPGLGPPGSLAESWGMYELSSQSVMQETVRSASQSDKVLYCQLVGARPGGANFYVDATATARRDAAQSVIGLYGTIQDVTTRVRESALLSASERRLFLATASAKIGIWDLQLATGELVWDARMYELYGISAQDFGGAYAAWVRGLHPADRQRAEAELAAALDGTKEFHTEFRILRPNGEERDLEAHAVVERTSDGTAISMIGVNWDVTERRRADTNVRRLNRVYAVLSGINELILRARDRYALFGEACQLAIDLGHFQIAWIGVIDPTGAMILPAASAGAVNYANRVEGGITLSEPTPLDGSSKAARAIRERTAVVTNEVFADTTMALGTNPRDLNIASMATLPLLMSGEAVGVLELYSDEENFFSGQEIELLQQLAGDIAFAMDHIEKQKRLDFLAYYDVLTGLANRNLFLERLGRQVRRAGDGGEMLALALFDLERFHSINETLGRSSGDALLREVGEWLTGAFSEPSLVARVGGDNFAAVVLNTDEAQALCLVESIIERFIEHSFQLNSAVFRISVQVGVAIFPADGDSADTLFKNAELALKKAKTSGDRCVRYSRSMSEAVAGRLVLESRLRAGLENEEFVLHYQPKISLMTGKLTGAEALIRWNDPRTGLVPPNQFIPILEETGLIYPVGRWALRKAIDDYLKWRAAGLAVVRIAVNVSPLQLRQRGFLAEIADVTGLSPFASAGLELEITESMLMEDIDLTVASLEAIRAMGVTVALDDFGTGFSSLSHLVTLPVDSLKIDRVFVNMAKTPQGLALVSTIINLARSLSLKSVAEGVETDEQAQLLRSLGCDEMQGFLISRPVPANLFETRYLMAVRTERQPGQPVIS
jgi:diguanylate cyclase (GGDEF)-like protein/PAS domain S-box-containing protein